ncbi:MAG: hypothetical protein Q9227_009592 [Pyrenula ochraceoflavens]
MFPRVLHSKLGHLLVPQSRAALEDLGELENLNKLETLNELENLDQLQNLDELSVKNYYVADMDRELASTYHCSTTTKILTSSGPIDSPAAFMEKSTDVACDLDEMAAYLQTIVSVSVLHRSVKHALLNMKTPLTLLRIDRQKLGRGRGNAGRYRGHIYCLAILRMEVRNLATLRAQPKVLEDLMLARKDLVQDIIRQYE